MRYFDQIKPNLEEWRLQLWSQVLGDEYKELAESIYIKWKHIRNTCLTVPESTFQFLNNLRKRYRLALITNGHSEAQWEKIYQSKVETYFDAIVVSGDTEWEKPAPEIFFKVCNILDVHPYECLMIGDRLETDIKGGQLAQLGITVWLPLPGADLENPSTPPDFVISDISSLPTILQTGQEMSEKAVPKHQRSVVLKQKRIINEFGMLSSDSTALTITTNITETKTKRSTEE